MIVNLTPHEIKIIQKDGTELVLPPSGETVRVSMIEAESTKVDNCPVVTNTLGQVEGLPDPISGTYYLVSRMVLDALSDRPDVIAPDTGKTALRDERGQIVAVRQLVRKSVVIPPGLTRCTRCDHAWSTRLPGRPKQCPRCRSRYWDTPRQRNRKREIVDFL